MHWIFRTLTTALILLGLGALSGCSGGHRITAKERDQAAIQYDLGVEAMRVCDSRTALAHFQKAVQTDPELEVAHAALALVYHTSFANPEKAIAHYEKALALRPKFTEARGNLASVYQDLGRYDEAIRLNEEVLEDVLYRTPFIAENNLGWSLYKTGKAHQGINHIRTAILANPQFCLGYRNLGIIYGELGDEENALNNLVLYANYCPNSADAQLRLGMAYLKRNELKSAFEAFGLCIGPREDTKEEKARPLVKGCRRVQDMAILEECRKQRALLSDQISEISVEMDSSSGRGEPDIVMESH